MNKKECIILQGIPTSGKSSWASKQNLPILSCDKIRIDLFGKNYKFSKYKEDLVWKTFYGKVSEQTESFIVDNTNCKEIYITRIKDGLKPDLFNVRIVSFDIPLWKAYYRNIKRWLFTGKYIPVSVIKSMKINYDKIRKSTI